MKKLTLGLVLLAVGSLVSCTTENEDFKTQNNVAEWQLKEVVSDTISEGDTGGQGTTNPIKP